MPRRVQGRNITDGLGRAIVNEKRRKKADHRQKLRYVGPNLVDEHDNDAGALESVLQDSHLDDFLMRAMMAEREFTAEKEHTVFLGTTAVQQKEVHDEVYDYEHVAIPRRPAWTPGISREQLHENETKAYLAWRANLADMEANAKDRRITPYEKNLEVWRQLWRVVERSDVVIQIVDARNPLLFRSEDLENYVREIDAKKHVLLLVNKADLLSALARRRWAEYFRAAGIPFLFFSALAHGGLPDPLQENHSGEPQQQQQQEPAGNEPETPESKAGDEAAAASDAEDQDDDDLKLNAKQARRPNRRRRQRLRSTTGVPLEDQDEPVGVAGAVHNPFKALDSDAEEEEQQASETEESEAEAEAAVEEAESSAETPAEEQPAVAAEAQDDAKEEDEEEQEQAPEIVEMSTTRVLNRQQLLDFLLHNYGQHTIQANKEWEAEQQRLRQRAEAGDEAAQEQLAAEAKKKGAAAAESKRPVLNVGMVGYPNVGKSSTINVLLRSHKVSVAPTPGKTKHFQTHFLPEHPIMVCDCPGLVFPTFAHTAADLVLNGILSVDHLRDWQPSVALLCRKLGRLQIRNAYSIQLPEDRAITPVDLLEAYARMRSFFRGHGMPDFNRCARILLKDAVVGKLVCCMPPPGLTPEQIQQFHDSYRGRARLTTIAELQEEERRAELQMLRERQQRQQLEDAAAEAGGVYQHVEASLPAEADMPVDSLSRVVDLGPRDEDDPLLRRLLAQTAPDAKLSAMALSGVTGAGGQGALKPGQKRREVVSRKEEGRQLKEGRRLKARNRFRGVEADDSKVHVISAFGRDGKK